MYYLCFDKTKDVTFCSAGRFISSEESIHPKRRLDSAVLLLGYKGEYPIAQEGREYVLKSDCVQVLFPGCEHYGTSYGSVGQSHFWCHFYPPEGWTVTDTPPSSEEDSYVVLPEFFEISESEKYFVLFRQLIDEAEKSTAEKRKAFVVCDCYVKILLCLLSESIGALRRGDPVGKRAITAEIKEYLRHAAPEGITAGDAAKKLGYNADHLNRLIKSDTGMTLSSYLNYLRISRAKSLILNSGMKITQIAAESGFSDEKYFMKVFKKHEGVTPTAYREAHFRVHLNH